MTEIKACCAAAYESDLVALVLGESYHPGGLALTRRLAGLLRLQPGQRVLDVASGPGTTALLLASEFGVRVDGVELSEISRTRAASAAERTGLAGQVAFHQADAERLPFPDETFAALVCECAFCTFPGKAAAAGEFARVLRPGGRLAISDVTLRAGGLPPELTGLAGWIACLADARPVEQYARLLTDAGLIVTTIEPHDAALSRMVAQIDARLRALRMTPTLAGVDLDRALHLTRQAADAVAAGVAGYAVLVAEKPRRQG